MQSHQVRVTLAAPTQLATADIWSQIKASLAKQFPLRTLHWKPNTRTSIRTIQYLDVELIPVESVREEGTSQIPLTLLDRPFLNIFVVACEDNETYKATVKKQIKDWHSSISQRKNQEWLILLVTKPDSRQNASGLLRMRGTVLERIRADFNVDKRDRCVQLTLLNEFDSPQVWADIISKMKEGVTSAFDAAVSQREEEIKRSESQRQMPGWNFCTFFVLKESLASSFEGMNLLDDAFLQYEELEASFANVIKDSSLIWFGKFIEPAPNDDSLPLLSVTKKPYRDLILANTITVFDFRVYLLARQCSLLGKMGKLSRVARKVTHFLSMFGNRLRGAQDQLPKYFIESWIYSSALSTLETCEEWKGQSSETPDDSAFSSAKGELLELARSQLDGLGIDVGYLPDNPPFSRLCSNLEDTFPDDPVIMSPSSSPEKVSNKDIAKFLFDGNAFYSAYIKITNQAIDSYVKAGRRKFALKLHGGLAALDLHRERHTSALQVYASLPAHYATHQWSSLESYMLLQGLNNRNDTDTNEQRPLVESTIAFINAMVSHPQLEVLDDVHVRDSIVSSLVDKLCAAAGCLDSEVTYNDSPFLVLQAVNSIRLAGKQDGYFGDIEILNRLPCAVPLNTITLKIKSSSTVLSFSCEPATVKPGRQTITLFCPIPSPGAFITDSFEVHLGKVVLLWSQKEMGIRKASGLHKPAKLLRLPVDTQAFSVAIQQPTDVEVGGPSRLHVTISSGRNAIHEAKLRISSTEIVLNTKSACPDKNSASVHFSDEGVILSGLPRSSTVSFYIPYTSSQGWQAVNVVATAEYVTEDDPNLMRSLSTVKRVHITEPLTVNVRDFFRGERLFSCFTISSVTNQYIRICSVDLQTSDAVDSEVKITHQASRLQDALIVGPAQPATFVFQIERLREVKEALRLRIKYRMLLDEVENLLRPHNKQPTLNGDHSGSQSYSDAILREFKDQPSLMESYAVLRVLRLPETLSDSTQAKDLIKDVNASLGSAWDSLTWRNFTIPVDLPSIDILAAADIHAAESPFCTQAKAHGRLQSIYAGQPFTAVVSVRTSCYWSGPERRIQRQYHMRFEVEEMLRDWLISGQKRGDFVAEHDTTYSVSITLMALRHGEIPLPKVNVSLLPTTDDTGQPQSPPLTLETHQVRGAEKLFILPRGGKTTYLLDIGHESGLHDPSHGWRDG